MSVLTQNVIYEFNACSTRTWMYHCLNVSQHERKVHRKSFVGTLVFFVSDHHIERGI